VRIVGSASAGGRVVTSESELELRVGAIDVWEGGRAS